MCMANPFHMIRVTGDPEWLTGKKTTHGTIDDFDALLPGLANGSSIQVTGFIRSAVIYASKGCSAKTCRDADVLDDVRTNTCTPLSFMFEAVSCTFGIKF